MRKIVIKFDVAMMMMMIMSYCVFSTIIIIYINNVKECDSISACL